MFYRGLGGCAETLDKIRELAPLKMPGLKDLRVRNTHVACDDEGRMHMIFNTPDRRHIHYSASPDGNQWSRPVRLANMAGGVISKGQLILDKGRACILYDRSGRGFVRGVTLGASPSAGPAIKVGHWLAQLGGAGLHRTKDGQVLLVGGGDVGVLMRAKLSDLMKLPAGAPPTTAPAADKPQMQPARR